jgi:hypothetical protein
LGFFSCLKVAESNSIPDNSIAEIDPRRLSPYLVIYFSSVLEDF